MSRSNTLFEANISGALYEFRYDSPYATMYKVTNLDEPLRYEESVDFPRQNMTKQQMIDFFSKILEQRHGNE